MKKVLLKGWPILIGLVLSIVVVIYFRPECPEVAVPIHSGVELDEESSDSGSEYAAVPPPSRLPIKEGTTSSFHDLARQRLFDEGGIEKGRAIEERAYSNLVETGSSSPVDIAIQRLSTFSIVPLPNKDLFNPLPYSALCEAANILQTQASTLQSLADKPDLFTKGREAATERIRLRPLSWAPEALVHYFSGNSELVRRPDLDPLRINLARIRDDSLALYAESSEQVWLLRPHLTSAARDSGVTEASIESFIRENYEPYALALAEMQRAKKMYLDQIRFEVSALGFDIPADSFFDPVE